MTNRSSQYTDAHKVFHKNQRRQKKPMQFRHRAVLHALFGLAFFGFFMTSFTDYEQMIGTKLELYPEDVEENLLYDVPKIVVMQQKHGSSVYDIAGKTAKRDTDKIRVNRTKKRNSTYFKKIVKIDKDKAVQQAAQRAKQIAALDRQAAIHEMAAQKIIAEKIILKQTSSEIKAKKIANLPKVSDKKQALTVLSSLTEQPSSHELIGGSKITPKILSASEIEKLKQDTKNQAEIYVAEQVAPMPTIHSGKNKSQFVEAMLSQVTAQAHETELGWSAGNGKSSSIRRQVIALDKLNGFTIVNGKIATKVAEEKGERILMANVKVPAPLKRPKYIPKPKAKVISTSRTSLTCLTTALYHEVRGESRAGQLAVAEVISARRRSRSYPNTFCGVIYQNATRRNACQFSFACDGKTDLPRDLKTWKRMKQLAGDFLAGRASAPRVRGATHYHTKAVSPKWRWSMKRLGSIGAHIFYKDPRAKA